MVSFCELFGHKYVFRAIMTVVNLEMWAWEVGHEANSLPSTIQQFFLSVLKPLIVMSSTEKGPGFDSRLSR